MATIVSALTCYQITKVGGGVDAFESTNRTKLLHLNKKSRVTTVQDCPLMVKASTREDASAATTRAVRRELLVGGAAGACSLALSHSTAKAAPVPPPNLDMCGASIGITPGASPSQGQAMVFRNCCPPSLSPDKKLIDFQPDKGVLRIRQPLHKAVLDEEFLNKYHEAYRRMRALPDSDPRSMKQQANVHCVYCNDGYRPSSPDAANPNKRLQIHFGWFFLPWHRFYLHFHEKILGSLIEDPTFALPFWNWDNQYTNETANMIPSVFNDKEQWPAIYDKNRDQSHYGQIVDLSLGETPAADIRQGNLNVMSTSVADVRSQELFFGKPYRFNDINPINVDGAAGSLEASPHTAVHVWVGDPRNPLREDMGNFYSAGRDPLFYLHHSNVDRLWTVWKTLDPGNVDISDADYLESEFLFYDENQNLVKCRVKDASDNVGSLSYTYAPAPDTQWICYTPPVKNTLNLIKATATPLSGVTEVKNGEPAVFDVDLPPSTTGARDIALVLKGVGLPMGENRSFHVFLNLPQAREATSVNCAEYVGSWNNVPHLMGSGGNKEATFDVTFSIRKAIDVLKLSGSVTVTVVPVGDRREASFTIAGATVNTFDK